VPIEEEKDDPCVGSRCGVCRHEACVANHSNDDPCVGSRNDRRVSLWKKEGSVCRIDLACVAHANLECVSARRIRRVSPETRSRVSTGIRVSDQEKNSTCVVDWSVSPVWSVSPQQEKKNPRVGLDRASIGACHQVQTNRTGS